MAGSAVLIRSLSLEEVRDAVGWADREGWEPGLGDADPFFAPDPGAFFAAEADGSIVATISAVRCSPDVVFMGFYIVEPELRGTGVGKHLYDEIVARLAPVTLGGDAVPQQVAN
jgi:GNAT superfamily N-acetyltransferase